MTVIVSALHIYPIKSCRALPLQMSAVEQTGLHHDRRWAVVDSHSLGVMTQRTHPQLSTVSVHFMNEEMEISAPGYGRFTVPANPTLNTQSFPVKIDAKTILADDCGKKAEDFFSTLLGRSARLFRMPNNTGRYVPGTIATHVAFADAYPLMVISKSSLDDLNRLIMNEGGKPVSLDQFRANIVIEGCPAYAEDGLQRMQVGQAVIKGVKPCTLDSMTMIDQTTGTLHANKEPLRTLRRQNRQNGAAMFGMYFDCLRPGTLRQGDELTAL